MIHYKHIWRCYQLKKYNWAILGAGLIGNEMAAALNDAAVGVYAVYNRTHAKAEAFAKKYDVQRIFDNAGDMLADPAVDIVYIATPHNVHYEHLLMAVEHGKHVLCEKAITVNDMQLKEIRRLANEKNVVVMEAMTLYHMPLFQELRKMVDADAIGKVKMIQINFGSLKEYDVNNRFFSKELAGGALLDIGVYAVSLARWFLSAKPNRILSTAHFFETGVDEQSGIILSNPEGQLSVIALTMRAKQPKRAVIAGEKGYIEVYNYPRGDTAAITYSADGRTETIESGDSRKALQYEILDMQKAIEMPKRQDEYQFSLDVMEILSEVRRQWRLSYPFE